MGSLTIPMEIKTLTGTPAGVFVVVGFTERKLSPSLQSLAARQLLACLLRLLDLPWIENGISDVGIESLPKIEKEIADVGTQSLPKIENRRTESLSRIEKDGEGKPYFPEMPWVHFSLSHTERAVMAAISGSPIGCDIVPVIEGVTPELLSLCLSAAERRQLYAEAEAHENIAEAFTRIWTRKEAAIKRQGRIPEEIAAWPSDAPRLHTWRERGFYLSVAY